MSALTHYFSNSELTQLRKLYKNLDFDGDRRDGAGGAYGANIVSRAGTRGSETQRALCYFLARRDCDYFSRCYENIKQRVLDEYYERHSIMLTDKAVEDDPRVARAWQALEDAEMCLAENQSSAREDF